MGRTKVAELLKEASHYLEVQDATRGGFQQDVWLSAHVFSHTLSNELWTSWWFTTFTDLHLEIKVLYKKMGREMLIKLLLVWSVFNTQINKHLNSWAFKLRQLNFCIHFTLAVKGNKLVHEWFLLNLLDFTLHIDHMRLILHLWWDFGFKKKILL